MGERFILEHLDIKFSRIAIGWTRLDSKITKIHRCYSAGHKGGLHTARLQIHRLFLFKAMFLFSKILCRPPLCPVVVFFWLTPEVFCLHVCTLGPSSSNVFSFTSPLKLLKAQLKRKAHKLRIGLLLLCVCAGPVIILTLFCYWRNQWRYFYLKLTTMRAFSNCSEAYRCDRLCLQRSLHRLVFFLICRFPPCASFPSLGGWPKRMWNNLEGRLASWAIAIPPSSLTM